MEPEEKEPEAETKPVRPKKPRRPPVERMPNEEFVAAYEASGLDESQFAHCLGIGEKSVSYILSGKRKVSRRIAKRFKEAMSKGAFD